MSLSLSLFGPATPVTLLSDDEDDDDGVSSSSIVGIKRSEPESVAPPLPLPPPPPPLPPFDFQSYGNHPFTHAMSRLHADGHIARVDPLSSDTPMTVDTTIRTDRDFIVDTAENESRCLVTPGRIRLKCGTIVRMDACISGYKCIANRIEIPGGKTGTLASMVYPHEWDSLKSGFRRPPKRQCILCYRYSVGTAALLCATTNGVMPRDIVIGTKRLPTCDGVGSYREDALIFPPLDGWNGILYPSVRLEPHRLRVHPCEELASVRSEPLPPQPEGALLCDEEEGVCVRIDQSQLISDATYPRTLGHTNFRM